MPKTVRDNMKRIADQAMNDLDRYIGNIDYLDFNYKETEQDYDIQMVQERAIVLTLKAFAAELKNLTQEYKDRFI